MSIVDKERNVVSMTNTVNAYFGAKISSKSTGIVLNNEMDDFSMPVNDTANDTHPSSANFISPGKRPLSSMSPTIVLKVYPIILHNIYYRPLSKNFLLQEGNFLYTRIECTCMESSKTND